MSEKRDYLQAAADLKRIVGALKRVVPHVRKLGTIKSAAERLPRSPQLPAEE